ncbi:MAG TPA: CpsB/CapC family capsule biosynthesis tyrosine phosphatase [Solirubrobacteraceae bacterium]
MVDLHCHVLPGIDDGPRTLDESVAVCRAARSDGTRTLVATPHVSWDFPDVTAAAIHAEVAAVNLALRAADVDAEVRTGAEVALSRAGELSDGELELLALGGGHYVLLEFPWTSVAAGPVNALRAFARRGFGIVLAHPERSPMLQRDGTLVRELVDAGVLCCLDAGSLAEHADRHTREAAWMLLAAGLAHAIASDCHDAVRRPPELASTLERAGLTARQIDYFARDAPEAIVNGEDVAPPPAVANRHHRRWFRLGRW